MTDNQDDFPIIRTKLHRPRVPNNHVYREMLVERLQNFNRRPAILVSAAAGYGKSTLVSCWLETCGCPSAWLSLDENDNELQMFLVYFVAAVQSLFPDSLTNSAAMVIAPNLPPVQGIVNQMANELDAIDQDFVLVLDDIHHIQKESVHDFLDGLLRHPPRPMHLVLIGRHDPLLSIPALRARSQLGEIRLQNLRFSEAETETFLQQMLQTSIDGGVAAAWTEKMEGWVTGLRLAALSMKHRADMEPLSQMQMGFQYVMEYLFCEVLLHQPTAVRDMLLETSILNRFCAPLCDAVHNASEDSERQPDGAWKFIQLLKNENLFIISLDAKGHWFRYHHLFQQLLQNQLKRKYQSEEIAALHAMASKWFENHGSIEESIKHALKAGDVRCAAEIVEEHRYHAFNADRWYVVNRWINMLPADIRQKRLKLILTDAWIATLQHHLDRARGLLERAEPLLQGQTADPMVSGEYAYLRGYGLYFEGQAEGSQQLFEEAVSQLSGKKNPFLGEAELMLGMARCMTGQKKLAVSKLKAHINAVDPSENFLLSRLIAGLIFIYLIIGESLLARAAAQRLLKVSKQHNMRLTEGWSYYFLACSHLHTGELEAASQYFEQASKLRYVLEPRAAVDALAGLALTQQLMGLADEAADSCFCLEVFALEMKAPIYLPVAQSCRSRLAVLRGDLASAAAWCRSTDDSLVFAELWMWLEAPLLTQTRVLIAIGSSESLNQAAELLQTIRHKSETCWFTSQTIEAAVLQSLVLEKQGRTDDAMVTLDEALSLAEPGEWIRPFVEAGPVMVDLLKRMQRRNIAVGRVETLLAALEKMLPAFVQQASGRDRLEPQKEPPPLIDPLTNRELDILELLDRRMQNKEIAEKLCISPQTVASHLKNIYQKIGVNNRLKAVQAAKRLKII